jgi:hypothetical protein
MMKYWFAGVATFALMTGAALAQSSSSDTTTSTQSTTVPAVGSYSSTKSQKTIDSNGTETDKSRSYTSGADGTKASSSSLTTTPDGSKLSTSHEERTAGPPTDITTTNRSTTTTTDH